MPLVYLAKSAFFTATQTKCFSTTSPTCSNRENRPNSFESRKDLLVKMTRNFYNGGMTKSMSVTEAKSQFSSLVEDAIRGEETIITKHGKPVAKIIPYERPKLILGLLEGKMPDGWEEIDFDDNSHMDEAWAKWRKKLERLGE